ncbi:MAG: hypothetical protein JSR75_03975 [Proteobacteria bacterium]|nr:hypothetical protein [Pseudomonadota bacterium]
MKALHIFLVATALAPLNATANPGASADRATYKLAEPLYLQWRGNWNTPARGIIDSVVAKRSISTVASPTEEPVSVWLKISARKASRGMIFTTYPLVDEWMHMREIRGLGIDVAAKDSRRFVISKASEEEPTRAESVSVWACSITEVKPSESACFEAQAVFDLSPYQRYFVSMPGLARIDEIAPDVSYMTADAYAQAQQAEDRRRSDVRKEDAERATEARKQAEEQERRLGVERDRRAALIAKLPSGPYSCRKVVGSSVRAEDSELASYGNRYRFMNCAGMNMTVDDVVLVKAGLRLVNITETDVVATPTITGDVLLDGKKLYHYYK